MVQFIVDDRAMVQAFVRVEEVLGRVVDLAAEVVALEAEQYGGAETPKLGEPWRIEPGPGGRQVEAPEWWAHFLAHGTSPHGPAKAPFLVFQADGDTVFAQSVSGIAGSFFDVKAVEASRSKVDQLISQAIQGAA